MDRYSRALQAERFDALLDNVAGARILAERFADRPGIARVVELLVEAEAILEGRDQPEL